MNDSRKLAVHFLSGNAGNSAVIKRELFRGDDATTRSLMFQLWEAALQLGEGLPQWGTSEKSEQGGEHEWQRIRSH